VGRKSKGTHGWVLSTDENRRRCRKCGEKEKRVWIGGKGCWPRDSRCRGKKEGTSEN